MDWSSSYIGSSEKALFAAIRTCILQEMFVGCPPYNGVNEISSWLSLNSSSKSGMGENKTEANARLIVLLLFKDKKIPGEPMSSMPRRSQVVIKGSDRS